MFIIKIYSFNIISICIPLFSPFLCFFWWSPWLSIPSHLSPMFSVLRGWICFCCFCDLVISNCSMNFELFWLKWWYFLSISGDYYLHFLFLLFWPFERVSMLIFWFWYFCFFVVSPSLKSSGCVIFPENLWVGSRPPYTSIPSLYRWILVEICKLIPW